MKNVKLCIMVTAIKVVHFCATYFDCAFAESFASVVFVMLLAVHFADSQCLLSCWLFILQIHSVVQCVPSRFLSMVSRMLYCQIV